MKIRTSLYRTVFSLIVFPFILFALIITNIYSGRLEKVITESLHVVANAQVAEMTNFCEQQRKYLSLIGEMDVSRAVLRGIKGEGSLKYLNNILCSYARTGDYMKTITVLDKDHRVVASSVSDHRPFAAEGVECLIKSMEGRQFYLSDLLTDPEGHKTLVAISTIEDAGGLMGYVLAEIDLDFYKNTRRKAELWNEATIYILDGNQQIISAGTKEEDREGFVTDQEDRQDYVNKYNAIDFERNPQGSFRYKVGGKEYITYYSDVEYSHWQVLLTAGLENYKAEKTVYGILAAMLMLLCAVLAYWSGRFASRRIVHPIQSISDTLTGIQEHQDYSLRVPVEKKDELGSLGAEINGLIDFIETENLYKAQQQRLLQEKAEQDALTKVLNKGRISQYLAEAMDRHRRDGGRMAVLFVDIDDFKAFNTNYGHNVGDQVLLFLASLLARETCGAVGRVGGDEFLAVVEETSVVQDLEQCLVRIQELAGSRFLVRGSGVCLPVSCCIGAVRVDFGSDGGSTQRVPAPEKPVQGEATSEKPAPEGLTLEKSAPEKVALEKLTPEKLTGMADQAMYQVKNHGKQGYAVVDIQVCDR